MILIQNNIKSKVIAVISKPTKKTFPSRIDYGEVIAWASTNN